MSSASQAYPSLVYCHRWREVGGGGVAATISSLCPCPSTTEVRPAVVPSLPGPYPEHRHKGHCRPSLTPAFACSQFWTSDKEPCPCLLTCQTKGKHKLRKIRVEDFGRSGRLSWPQQDGSLWSSTEGTLYPQQVTPASPPLTHDHCHWATCLNGTKTAPRSSHPRAGSNGTFLF